MFPIKKDWAKDNKNIKTPSTFFGCLKKIIESLQICKFPLPIINIQSEHTF